MNLSKKYVHSALTVSIVTAGLGTVPFRAIAGARPCPALSPVLHGSPPLTDPTTVAFRNYATHAPVQCVA
jgi:hypothetical protein